MPQTTPPPGHVPVRLSIRPDEIRHVPADEARILRQQGLLVEDEAPAAGAKPDAKAPAGKPGAGKDT